MCQLHLEQLTSEDSGKVVEGLQGIHSLPLPGTQGETISSAAQYGKDAREASTLPTCSCCIYGVLRLALLEQTSKLPIAKHREKRKVPIKLDPSPEFGHYSLNFLTFDIDNPWFAF